MAEIGGIIMANGDDAAMKLEQPCDNATHENSAAALVSTEMLQEDTAVGREEVLRSDRTLYCINKCAVCHKEARYCCPKCALRTCSLNCVRAHKAQTGCNGIRDRAAFIPMNKFTDLNLLSDYRFLEESARTIDNAMRNPMVKPHQREKLSQNLCNIQKFVWRRTRISLHFLPQMFTRHKLNRTSIKRSILYWTLELHAPQGQLIVIKHDIASSRMLKDIITQFLEDLSVAEKERASGLVNASTCDICVLMKVLGRPVNDERYIELNIDISLEENLQGKRLLEFPTLIIVTSDHRGAFQLDDMKRADRAKQTELPSFFREDEESDNDDQEHMECL
ncbi:box C/D snoRNA protein 1-like [Tropilaelaps mercedesae]|uniref:Box C/D snoRNA protein 1-like n=1 Tax=Tropilaelaps mercedesae TaxID=418985 RepID=A0A1V9X5A6_9ACAR|nr:box C/D snoRNA protein 1-like [Tropilaelaps mercedesae]